MRGLVFVLFVFFFQDQVKAQAEHTSLYYDSLTYIQFVENKFDSLLLTGADALKSGIDFYYLRYRMGIAAYSTGKYYKAIAHLEKARSSNAFDPLVKEYLYWSYTFVGSRSQALCLKGKYDTLIGVGPRLFASVDAEGAYALSNNEQKNKSVNLKGDENIYGEAERIGNVVYDHAGLFHELGNRFSLYHGYSYIQNSKVKAISVPNFDTLHNYKAIQHEYYALLNFQINTKWRALGFFKYIGYNSPTLASIYDNQLLRYNFIEMGNKSNNYLAGVGCVRDFIYFSIIPSVSAFITPSKRYYQANLDVKYILNKNGRLFGNSLATVLGSQSSKPGFVFVQSLGFRPFKGITVGLDYAQGALQNWQEKNGYVLYNVTDKINYRWGANFNLYLGKHLSVGFIYQYLFREYECLHYTSFITFDTIKITYNTQNLIANIKWDL